MPSPNDSSSADCGTPVTLIISNESYRNFEVSKQTVEYNREKRLVKNTFAIERNCNIRHIQKQQHASRDYAFWPLNKGQKPN